MKLRVIWIRIGLGLIDEVKRWFEWFLYECTNHKDGIKIINY